MFECGSLAVLHRAQEASFKKGDARQGAAAPKKRKKDVAGFEPTIGESKSPVLTKIWCILHYTSKEICDSPLWDLNP